MRSWIAPNIEALQPYVPGKPIAETRRQYGLAPEATVVKLASNENPLGPSPMALRAMAEALPTLHLYPDASHHELLEKLSLHLGLSRERIFVGNGSNEIIELLIRTFTVPGKGAGGREDEALICRGSFIMYKVALQSHGRRFVEVPMADGFRYDLEAMARAITPHTRIVFLANPDNPTGTAFSRSALEAFYARVPPDCLLVLDEAYFEYVEWSDYPNGLHYLERWPNLVVLRTFSKIYGLAGERVGYAAMAPELVAYLNRTRMPFNVTTLGQVAAAAALGDSEHPKKTRELTRQGRERLSQALREMGLRLSDSHANFVYADLGRPAAPVVEALMRRGTIVRPLKNYDMPNAVRISVGLPDENERLIRELKHVLGGG